jgi:hypothetical protein
VIRIGAESRHVRVLLLRYISIPLTVYPVAAMVGAPVVLFKTPPDQTMQ